MHKIDNNPKSSSGPAALESPQANERVYDQSISISGTIDAVDNREPGQIIHAWIDNICIGETRIFLQIEESRLGYKLLAKLPDPIAEPRSAVIVLTLSGEKETETKRIGEVSVELVPAGLHDRHYGDVVPPEQGNVLHRENIYGSGPPVEQPSPEALRLVLDHLPPQSSIVDVGCGAGAYGPPLINAGHRWLGLELNDNCIELLEERNLPYRKLQGPNVAFPCADGEFDHAICIEVLEHTADPESFLKEIARVIRGRSLFSVPNIEVLPFLKDWEVVPWHLLEADHKNFFTRASLQKILSQYFRQVEVFSYGEHPLRTRDEIALHLHLFAVADSSRALP
jgi:2-polyprenyl-3-methyl-5-hydroxy-6-metoxy-1,4-benzoquinol methylase